MVLKWCQMSPESDFGAKRCPNGAKMVPKWCQNTFCDAKMVLIGAKMVPLIVAWYFAVQ